MSDWNDFETLDEYRGWITDQGWLGKFSSKIGVFSSEKVVCFDQHGNFFHTFIPSPPAKKEDPKESVLGIHLSDHIDLSAEFFYCDPVEFVRQGDIFTHNDAFGSCWDKVMKVIPTHWIIVSQTCIIENQPISLIIPGFFAEVVLEHISDFSMKKPNPITNLKRNKTQRWISFPPHEKIGGCNKEDRGHILFDSLNVRSIQSETIKSQSPIISLTFPGNSYFCNRIAINLFRDVEKWDDRRVP